MKKLTLNHNKQPREQTSRSKHEPIEKVFYKLKQLHEIQDESRNELCPVFTDQESNHKFKKQSTWASHHQTINPNILAELDDSDEKGKKADTTSIAQSKRSSYNYFNDQDLRVSNLKLKEDNMKLFAQCIRLRKKCLLYEKSASPQKKQIEDKASERERVLEKELALLRNHVEDLANHNKRLQEKVKRLTAEVSSASLISIKYKEQALEIEDLTIVNEDLTRKVLHLQKQLELSQTSRNGSKSSSSQSVNNVSNTTQESRRSEVDKDRMISNMRVVHESEVRKLKGVIEDLRRQLERERGDPLKMESRRS